MAEEFSIHFLSQYWWCISSLFAGVMVFMLFVQGGQVLVHQLGKTEIEQKMLIKAVGHKWGLSFAALAAWIAVMWGAFPLFYAVSISGAYIMWILIMLCYVTAGCAFEFRSKSSYVEYGVWVYDKVIMMSGFNAALLLGVMIATFFTGSPFAVDIHPQSGLVNPTWMGIMGGMELMLDLSHYTSYVNISLGVAFVFWAVIMGAMYIKYIVDNEDIERRATKVVRNNMPFFILFFVFFLVNIWARLGYEYSTEGYITIVPQKYLTNIIEMPQLGILCIVGAVLMLCGMIRGCRTKDRKGFGYMAVGTIIMIFALMCSVGLNNTVFYPASGQWIQNGLTIENSISGVYSMEIMFYISLFMPLVILYVVYVWKKINKAKIDKASIQKENPIKPQF